MRIIIPQSTRKVCAAQSDTEPSGKSYWDVTCTVMVSDFCTKSEEELGVVKRKSRLPLVSELNVDEAVRYVSVAWNVM